MKIFKGIVNMFRDFANIFKKDESWSPVEPVDPVEPKILKDYIPNGSEFIAIDTETTGLNSDVDSIVEVAAIKYSNGEIVETFQTLINPGVKISSYITNINNITNSMVADKPKMLTVLPKFMEFISDYPLVGHNIFFDIGFLKKYCNRLYKTSNYWFENECIDTVKLGRELFPKLQNHKLQTIVSHLNMNVDAKHRAYDDAIASAEIYKLYLKSKEDEYNDFIESLNSLESLTISKVKEVLRENNINLSNLNIYKTSNYLDFNYSFGNKYAWKFLRFKLNGHLMYLLFDEDINSFKKIYDYPNATESSKSQGNKTRISIDSEEDILTMDTLILDSYFKVREEFKALK